MFDWARAAMPYMVSVGTPIIFPCFKDAAAFSDNVLHFKADFKSRKIKVNNMLLPAHKSR